MRNSRISENVKIHECKKSRISGNGLGFSRFPLKNGRSLKPNLFRLAGTYGCAFRHQRAKPCPEHRSCVIFMIFSPEMENSSGHMQKSSETRLAGIARMRGDVFRNQRAEPCPEHRSDRKSGKYNANLAPGRNLWPLVAGIGRCWPELVAIGGR